jgi:hypothetical protein
VSRDSSAVSRKCATILYPATPLWLISTLDETQDLRLHKAKVFKHKRKSSLRRLIEQARNHHYSTFCLYNRREFAEALREFENRI